MSGLLERIARRRVKASNREGIASANQTIDVDGGTLSPSANGGSPTAEPLRNAAARRLDSGSPTAGLDIVRWQPLAVPDVSLANAGEEAGHGNRADPPGVAAEPEGDIPGFIERGRLRRRLRYLRHLREVQLRDIGGFMVELHRFGRNRPDLVDAKVAGAAAVDAELRALEAALNSELTPRELREPGIGGACAGCGTVHGSNDRYCSSCGCRLGAEPGDAEEQADQDDDR